MDTTGLAPANADDNASTEAAQVDSEAAEVEGADPAPAAAETGKSGKPAHSADLQERFDRLTREKYEGLSRAERAEYKAQMLEQRLQQLEATAKTEQVAPAKFPTLEEHGWDESKYANAVATYLKAQTPADPRQAVQEALREERERQEQETMRQSWVRKQAEFAKSKPDFMEKVYRDPASGGPTITEHMAKVIQASDIGPDVAYYLSENSEKSAEIARLPDYLQSREIGRIEARLEAAKANPAPPVSKAPPPVAKLDSADPVSVLDPTSPDSDKLSSDEWMRRRNKQLAKNRR